ncbi:hypothetical protein C8F01DRAFT_1246657 [Mycena amicta]|nr:hypothetical protein C8F01DRAFT_1246657 [Mycena amicta]
MRLWATTRGATRTASVPRFAARSYTANPKSPIRTWYSTILPAMGPIALLASAVYTGLLLAQVTLSHEKTMQEQAARLKQLEAEVDALANDTSKN